MNAASELAVADLADAVETKWRGFVDQWDPQMGIFGWALAADAPLETVSIELVVGNTPLARVKSSLPRADIDSLLGVRVTPGFHFPAEIFARVARLKPERRTLRARLRFAGTRIYLPGRNPDPTVDELVRAWTQYSLQSLIVHGPESNRGDELLSHLRALREKAEDLLKQPLYPSEEHELGRIEAFYIASAGELWFTGWMPRDVDFQFPFAVVERRKHTGAASTIQYERRDLASRFVGVAGVMITDWTPPVATSDWFVHADAGMRVQMRVPASIPLLGLNAFLARYREAQAASIGGDSVGLNALLTSGNRWLTGNAAAAGLAAEASVDRILFVPGFGCFAEGWALATARHITNLELKIGDTVLLADSSSLHFKPRPDLAGVFGGDLASLRRAGFVAAFRGQVTDDPCGTLLLKVRYGNGASTVHSLEAKVLLRLDPFAHSNNVLRWFPSLRQETFYAEFVTCLRRQLQRESNRLRPLAVSSAPKVLVIALPLQERNQRLCFDFAGRLDLSTDPDIGITFLTDDGEQLPKVKVHFDELAASTTIPLSLMCIPSFATGFRLLPQVLSVTNSDRFVFVEQGVQLTSHGWLAAVSFLRRNGHALRYFEFVDEGGFPDRINESISAACFGWSTAALMSWMPSAPFLLRSVSGTNGLPMPLGDSVVYASSATRLELKTESLLADLIDADVLSTSLPRVI